MGIVGKVAACALLLGAVPAFAQAAQGDPGQGTGPLPANVAPSPTPICTDRPTKANVACTVPAGDFQIESDLVNWTRDTQGGMRTDTIAYTDPVLKYGVGTHTDIEASLIPYETVRTRENGTSDTVGGVGDLYLRVKQRLTPDAAKTQVSLIPFVKAPTAKSSIGNGHWEGGLIVPVDVPLPGGFTLNLGPEIDILADDEGSGHHVALTTPVNVSHDIVKNLTGFVELWTDQELEPGHDVHQYSADVALAYLLTPTFEVDVGANVGLNRSTPDEQLYLGVSSRF